MARRIGKIYGITLSVGLLYFLWVKLTGLAIPCLGYLTTGMQCPGCGISRMFLAMARLDFAQAFSHNPVMFCLFFYWNLVALLCLLGRPGFVSKRRFLYVSFYLSVAALIIFTFIRNIP